jgi:endonuclease G
MGKDKKSRHGKNIAVTPELMEILKNFIRTKGEAYLSDPNISSIGIGYKITDKETTSDLSIQFTVNEKLEAEQLETLGSKLIPESIAVDGIEIPTDVLQRKYVAAYKLVTENSVNQRKTRIDPIKPGVSVANEHVSAGTIGCIVYDRKNATRYVLSNWHVLHGPRGTIGDNIVQPGLADDNRTSRNRLGKLIRSYLGIAGDCAIASIENRAFDQNIFDLGVSPKEIGEPDLGDKVIKSGRTTGVTHGVVNRIHTIVKIDYDGNVGEKSIGCFEIGPDPKHKPANGEISSGGDSGSTWMFKDDRDRVSNILAGLHFAGEASNAEPEHAMACYPQSVFEKLEITLNPATIDPSQQSEGYDPEFLGTSIFTPGFKDENVAVVVDGSPVIDYTHFSLALHKNRRFAIWVAWNIDGGNLKKLSRKNIPFVLDPRIPEQFQVGDSLYAGNRLDRGHIARRADLLWGSEDEAKRANKDSFYFTNISPQMDNFNQSGQRGIWGKLEDAIFEEVDVDNLKLSLFGGPVFKDNDRIYRGVKIPREFYKVLVYQVAGVLKAKAFILSQNLAQLEVFDLEPFKVYEAALSEIEERCQIEFPSTLKAADLFASSGPEAVEDRQPIEALEEIEW